VENGGVEFAAQTGNGKPFQNLNWTQRTMFTVKKADVRFVVGGHYHEYVSLLINSN